MIPQRYDRPQFSGGGGQPDLPPGVLGLVIANVLVYMFTQSLSQEALLNVVVRFGATPELFFKHFHLWQPFSYQFIHADMNHLFFNMFGVWMFGGPLERVLGTRGFLRFYLICGVGSGLIIEGFNGLISLKAGYGAMWIIPTVGASGALFGMLTAYAILFPNAVVYLFFVIPMSSRMLVIGYGIFSLVSLTSGGSGISHIGHLGGMAVGWLALGPAASLSQLRAWWRHRQMRKRFHDAMRRPPDDQKR